MSRKSVIPQGGFVYDINIGESVEFLGSDGMKRRIALVALHEEPDRVRGVIRIPRAIVDVGGERVDLIAGLYRLPSVVNGIKIACSVTRGIAVARGNEEYGLDKDARIRCWDSDALFFGPQPMVYPVRQLWFASKTQLGNEKTYALSGELELCGSRIYHHDGVDIMGYDKAVPVLVAVSGHVVRCRDEWADDEARDEDPRDDVVNIRDTAGWRYRYSHLDMIDERMRVGAKVSAGDLVGFMGKKGMSGGCSHLHFGIKAIQPSGRRGEVEAYPFLVEAYLHEHPDALLACARPHRTAGVGEPVEFDASASICAAGRIVGYEWRFHDGSTASGAKATRVYDREGEYSEMVTVTDERGRTDVDFCDVQILPSDADPARTPPIMSVDYYPSENLLPGQPVAFKVRTYFGGRFAVNKGGEERWDFGDGSQATTCSDDEYAERWHSYAKPGRYIVAVRRTGKNGISATVQVKVVVGGG